MAKKLVAILGTYRRGCAVDTAVDAVLAGAREKGAETKKIYLIEKNIQFCRNCRECVQEPGKLRGQCVIEDDMEQILAEAESADALVIASPVNFWNVTAVFRQFLERLLVYTFWPWGKAAPSPRDRKSSRKALILASAAMPGPLIPFATGAPRALKNAAKLLGAKPTAKLWLGLVSKDPRPKHSEALLRRAREIGMRLV